MLPAWREIILITRLWVPMNPLRINFCISINIYPIITNPSKGKLTIFYTRVDSYIEMKEMKMINQKYFSLTRRSCFWITMATDVALIGIVINKVGLLGMMIWSQTLFGGILRYTMPFIRFGWNLNTRRSLIIVIKWGLGTNSLHLYLTGLPKSIWSILPNKVRNLYYLRQKLNIKKSPWALTSFKN